MQPTTGGRRQPGAGFVARATLYVVLAMGFTVRNSWGADPEDRAMAYLAREVPAWSTGHACASCHNNGDGARALFEALRRGKRPPEDSLQWTKRWLSKPEEWGDNGGDGEFNDRRLARLQFTLALGSWADAGDPSALAALRIAAGELARDQRADGRWTIEGPEELGSPVTYGTSLATWQALRMLGRVDSARFAPQVARARDWLGKLRPVSLLDAASIVGSGFGDRASALKVIAEGQSDDGGWGPYANSPPEPFDTAVVLIALVEIDRPPPEIAGRIARGRAYLISQQGVDGAWSETTRPAGGESYAQRVSTAAWGLLALMATSPR